MSQGERLQVLPTRLSTQSERYLLNREAYLGRIDDLRARRAAARAGGPEKLRAKHLARNKGAAARPHRTAARGDRCAPARSSSWSNP